MGKVIAMKKRVCPRCGRPAGSFGSCKATRCIVARTREPQNERTTEIPRIEIVLCETEARAVKKNPMLAKAFESISRAAVAQYMEGLPRQCPKTGKPHRYKTNYDETYCEDCHEDARGLESKGKPYVKEIVLHFKTQDGQPYGSESRKCSECGVQLWIASDGTWTDDRAQWKDPPKGFVNCRKAEENGL